MAVSPQVIDLAACERLVGVAAKACPTASLPASTTVPPTPAPEWDALANSFASLGVAIAWGGTILAIIALIAGIAWAKLLRGIAREEARRCAEERMEKWLAEEAPQLLSRMNASMQDASLGDTEDFLAADEMGEEA